MCGECERTLAYHGFMQPVRDKKLPQDADDVGSTPRRRGARLRVVTSEARPSAGHADWSALMTCAQDGDSAAYRRLLTEVAPYLRSLARRHLSDAAMVEDAVQDSLICIHRLRHTYDPRRPIGPWVATIARRRAIDRFRRKMRRQARETELRPEHETFMAQRAKPHEDHDDHRRLHRAVAALPPAQRTAIRLLKFEDMSLAEASQRTGKSESALKVATHRALKSLMTALAGERR